jgi:serine/threonine protein kinase
MFVLRYDEVIQDKYSMGRKIGEGAFGVVLHAINKSTKQDRVVKMIPKRRASTDRSSLTNFNSEIKIL